MSDLFLFAVYWAVHLSLRILYVHGQLGEEQRAAYVEIWKDTSDLHVKPI